MRALQLLCSVKCIAQLTLATETMLHSQAHLLVKAMWGRKLYVQGHCTVKEFVISLITGTP